MTASRREFLGSSTVVAAALGAAAKGGIVIQDGVSTPNFAPVALKGNITFEELSGAGVSEAMRTSIPQAPGGAGVSWGIPFRIDRPILLQSQEVTEQTKGLKAAWLVFLHTTDIKPPARDARGFIT